MQMDRRTQRFFVIQTRVTVPIAQHTTGNAELSTGPPAVPPMACDLKRKKVAKSRKLHRVFWTQWAGIASAWL